MKNYKRTLALMLVLLTLAAALLIGCNDQKKTAQTTPVTEPDTQPTEQETVATEPTEPETLPPLDNGMYRVMVLPTANGSVVANCTEAKAGDKITLTVKPDAGYEVTSLIVNNQHGEETFEMPAQDVMVYARFGYPKGLGDVRRFPSGDFFGSAGGNHSSDVLDMSTDSGASPYLVMDAGKGTPLFAFVKHYSSKQFYLELTAKVTGIRSGEKYPKFGLLTTDGSDMVKFYLDMSTQRTVSEVGAVHQRNGGSDQWSKQTPFKLSKPLNLKSQSVKLGLLRDGNTYYFYVNDQLAATGTDLSARNTATGIFSFGTSVKVTDYTLVKQEAQLASLLSKAKADSQAFQAPALTQNFFKQKGDNAYTLTTNTDAGHFVDDVILAGRTMRESYYSIKGKLTLTNAGDWGQARILVSANADHEHVFALEKMPNGNYQIFSMSNAGEKEWTNWALIVDGEQNGTNNSVDFEIVVMKNQLYFVLGNKIYYTSDRVSMPQSTVKFAGINQATTTVEALDLEVFADETAAKAYLDTLSDRFGENFGESQKTYWTSNGVDLSGDKGENPSIQFVGGAPQYAYLNQVFTDKFCFETSVNVEAVLNNDGFPKFGIMTNDGKEMVKFFVDMNPQMTASHVGVVYQPKDGDDDWANSVSTGMAGMHFTGNDSVKLKVVRDANAYYFYVNDQLALYEGNGFGAENTAVGVFSFNAQMTASDYAILTGSDADGAIAQAKADLEELAKLKLSTNYFTEKTPGVYTLTTNSSEGHFVDEVMIGGKTMRQRWYRLSGKLTLTQAGDWGQARILVSADANNEYCIALERMPDGNYQIFTMSNAGEKEWTNWKLLVDGVQNGHNNSIEFQIVVIEEQLYFVMGNTIYYTGNRVNMTESTVKFAGINKATTTVEALDLEVFADETAAKAYVDTLSDRFGENFGESQQTYWTSNGVDLSGDKGENPSIQFVGGAPQYAYLNQVFADKFCFETSVNVETVLNNDGFPKFGIMTKDSKEMVKFFVDMNSQMNASYVGVVYQPNNGNDDWSNSISTGVAGMAFTGSNTVQLKLVRDGRAYYFYVNNQLVLHDPEGFAAEKGAVGIFSFNAKMTASQYRIATGAGADAAIAKAKADLEAMTPLGLTCNWFKEVEKGIFRLTTDSAAENKVDDLTHGGVVVQEAYYGLKGKLTLTNANAWGQARILVSADPKNEYVISLEQLPDGNYQIFTMSNVNASGWNNWTAILEGAQNGKRNSLNFELIVVGDRMYFLIDDQICYSSNLVPMTKSTVKFSGCNVGTTTVENLELEVFADKASAKAYADSKRLSKYFGQSQGIYHTTAGVDLSGDQGENPAIHFVGGAPQYAYLNDVFADHFCFETQFNVKAVLNNDGYPKFGVLVHDGTEMVKFFVDMTPAMTASHVGVVYQPNGGGDDWAHAVSTGVSGMSFAGSDTVKVKLVREGQAYYFYVNDQLVLQNPEGFKAQPGAVGIFSFNADLIASDYSIVVEE